MAAANPSVAAFLDHVADRQAWDALALAPRLAAILEQARRRRPEIELDPAVFVTHLAGHVDDLRALEHLHTDDLYLACALARGDVAALRVFEHELVGEAARALRRRGVAEAAIDETLQQLRTILLVANPPDGPRILRYAGRGPLRSWIHVAAVRAAVRERERSERSEDFDDERLLGAIAGDRDLAERFVAEESRAALRRGLAAAVAALDDRERTLLRLRVLDELGIDEIAVVYRVHRATAARRLHRARERLASELRRALARELGLPPWQLDSLIRAVDTHAGLSLARLLDPGGA